MNDFVTPKPGSGGVNLRNRPVVDPTSKVGGLVEGARLELEQACLDWHTCQVYVAMQDTQTADGFITVRPDLFQVNLQLAPATSDALDVGDLMLGQPLELITVNDDWFVARVFVSAHYSDVVNAHNPTPPPTPPTPPNPGPAPATSLITPAELSDLRLAPAQQRVPPSGFSQKHITATHIWNNYGGAIEFLAARVGIDVALAVAVVAIESGGHGFGADGRMVIRLEVHIFWGQWGVTHPDQFNALFAFNHTGSTSLGHKFRVNPNAPWQDVHTNQASEWAAFAVAQQLDAHMAKLSISMGLAQVMGFNFKRIGYATVEAMFDALSQDERLHVLSLFSFIAADGNLVRALQQNDLVTFARGYNGIGQEQIYATLMVGVQAAFGELVASRALAHARALGRGRAVVSATSPWSVGLSVAQAISTSKKTKAKRKRVRKAK